MNGYFRDEWLIVEWEADAWLGPRLIELVWWRIQG